MPDARSEFDRHLTTVQEYAGLNLSESDTRAYLVDPLLRLLGFADVKHLRREVTVPATKEFLDYELLVDGQPEVIVETLEAMAPALFRSWFVDFDPVRAKMEGRWHRGESLPGLPAEHYDLFSDRLVDSELGEIPEGWEVKALGECYDLTMGQSPPGNTYNDNGKGLPFFQGSTDFGERYPTNRRYCTEPARLAQIEDTLVSVRAPVGAINRAWVRCCIGKGVAALRHKSGSAPYTYYVIWTAQPTIGEYEHTGTVFDAIDGQQVRSLQMWEPPASTISTFHGIDQKLDSRISSNVAESRTLATQRDVLLPKLVSEDIQVTIG